jgi:two-component system sensor histidine kinase QseC
MYPLSGLVIWIIIGRGLSSLRRFANEVAQRAADHLEPVNLEEVPSEITPLVDELNKLFLRLKQAFDREQRFAGDAAHELRTPLAALKTQAQVALKATNPYEKQTHLFQVIAGVDRCTHVIQQLLTLSRMNPETVTLDDLTNVDLPKIATEVIMQLAPQAVDKQIEIELVAEDPDCIITGNTAGIYAMIHNLVDNAIRYTPNNGFIKVIIQNLPKQIVLRVIDTGTGIPAELRSRVFERFFRVLGTNTQGSGLGLAIVLQIAKLHKGDVILGTPENGIGLEVEVTFPKEK